MSSASDQSRRITVNAAFLKDIKDDNRELKTLLDKIAPLAEHPQVAVNHWRELVELLAGLRDQLAFHFTLEEAYGYFEDPIDVAPRLSEQADELRSEHGDLYADVVRISEALQDLPLDRPTEDDLSMLQQMCGEFLHRFDHHEARENALISQAFNEDIGVGD